MRAQDSTAGVRPAPMPRRRAANQTSLATPALFSEDEERIFASKLFDAADAAGIDIVLRELLKVARKRLGPIDPGVLAPWERRFKSAAAKGLASALDRAAEADLQTCRRAFNRRRLFIRAAGKALKAAAAQRFGPGLAASPASRQSPRAALNEDAFRSGADVALPFAAAPPHRNARGVKTTNGRAGTPVCADCRQPLERCGCAPSGRTGRWFRDGDLIVVRCARARPLRSSHK